MLVPLPRPFFPPFFTGETPSPFFFGGEGGGQERTLCASVILVPQPGIEPVVPALEVHSLDCQGSSSLLKGVIMSLTPNNRGWGPSTLALCGWGQGHASAGGPIRPPWGAVILILCTPPSTERIPIRQTSSCFRGLPLAVVFRVFAFVWRLLDKLSVILL